MKERDKLIIAIVAVVLIIIVVIGATYAYWQWSSNTAQRTNVSFTVPNSASVMGATLNGGGSSTVSNLAPAACTNGTYAFKKEVTLSYYNQTPSTADIKATLTLSNVSQPHSGTLRLNNLHYSLTTGTNAGNSCTSGTVVAGGSTSAFPAFTNGTKLLNAVTIKTAAANSGTSASPLSETYYLWIWIDSGDNGSNTGGTVTDPMQDLSFTLTWTGSMVQS